MNKETEIIVTKAQYSSLAYELKVSGIKFLVIDENNGTQDYNSMKELKRAIRDLVK